jgi:uncharacterized protein
MNNLTCRCVPGLDGLSAAELERLFPDSSSTAPLLSLLQDTGIEGFKLNSIVVSNNGAPILLLPLFETRFDLSAFVEGWIKKALKVAGRLIPSLFHPRILSVGTLVGEWSEIGIDSHTDHATLAAAYTLAFAALLTIAAERTSDIVALFNFNQYGKLPGEVFGKFNRVQYRSCARLSIDFSSIEEYLSRLSSGARKDVRRKMRSAPHVRVVHSRTAAPFLDRIYALYLETVSRGPLSLGVHSRQFFEKICENVPCAEYTLYFVQEELAAFNLLVLKPEAMVDMFFCMDFGLGRSNNLYVVSWLENIRSCLERNIPFYYAGQGTEKTKAHLGATFIPSFILFKHRRPLIDRLLVWPHTMTGKLLSRLGFWPAVSVDRLKTEG